MVNVLETLDTTHVKEILNQYSQQFGRDGSEYDIPEELKRFPKVRILRPSVDQGPITKLLPAIEYAQSKDKEALVITVDDDTGYPKGTIPELIYHSVKTKNSVVSGSGQDGTFWKL